MRDPTPRQAIALVLVVCAIAFFTGIGSISLFEPDEPRFAAATRQMVATGEYLTPWFNGEPRFEKPILFYWMQAPFFAALGPTEAAARLPAALCGTGAVLVLFAIGRRLFTVRAALFAALVLATSFRFVIYCRQGLTDVPVLFFEIAALGGFLAAHEGGPADRRHAWLAWACVGLAGATKGPVAAIPVLVWVAFLAVRREWREGLRRMHVASGAAIAVAIAAPWYVYMVVVHGRAYVDHALGYELVRRYADTEFPGPKRGVLYYFGVWPGDAAPWTLFFVAAVAVALARWRRLDARQRAGPTLAAVWFGIVLVLFSSASGKLPHYLLPLYPAVALSVAWLADTVSVGATSPGARLAWRVAVVGTALVLLAAAPLVALFLVRAFGAPPFGPAMLLPLALAGGAIAVLALEFSRRSAGVLPALVTTFAIGYAWLGVHVAPRYLQRMQPIRALGEAVGSRASPQDAVALYGSFGGPGLVFYSRHVVRFPPTHDAAAAFLSAPGRRFCVLSVSDLEEVRRRPVPELHVLARHEVLNVRINRVLQGRAADPRRALLLVSNQP